MTPLLVAYAKALESLTEVEIESVVEDARAVHADPYELLAARALLLAEMADAPVTLLHVSMAKCIWFSHVYRRERTGT